MARPALSAAEEPTVLRESAADLGRRVGSRPARLAALADTVVVTVGLAVIFGAMLAAARLLNP